jgi:hypothetical protein
VGRRPLTGVNKTPNSGSVLASWTLLTQSIGRQAMSTSGPNVAMSPSAMEVTKGPLVLKAMDGPGYDQVPVMSMWMIQPHAKALCNRHD